MIKHTEGRVVVKVSMSSKNSYRFGNGQILVMFPNTNNFDRRYSQPVNGIIISADDIPTGSEVLLEHNSTHDTNRIFELDDVKNPDIKYFSVPEMECFVWRHEHYISLENVVAEYLGEKLKFDWQPTKFYEIGENVYKPYKGVLQNVKPEQIKNTLLIKTGEYKNKIVHTLKDCGYIIIFQDTDGKPNEILTVFNVKDETDLDFSVPLQGEQISAEKMTKIRNYAKQEIIAVDNYLTEQYLNGELYAGLTQDDCKPIELIYDEAKI